MAKLTKKGFKRRKIIIGVSTLAAIGLVSTGFASWVVSQNASEETSGNVSIATITNQTVSFSKPTFTNSLDTIKFDAAKDDKTGYFMWDGTNSDNLSVSFSTTITNASNLAGVKVSMYAYTLDSSKEVKNTSIEAAATANYIVLPTCYSTAGDTINTSSSSNFTTTDNGSSYTFNYTASFAWGSAFGSLNPSVYLDNQITAGQLTLDAATQNLLTFYNTLSGTNHTSLSECNIETNLKFKITLEAILTSVNK